MTTVFHRVGAYEILHQVGSGGMAAVFLATDTRTNRQVALKLVSIEDDNDGRQIIEAERLGTKLQEAFCRVSRYVPTVFEYGTQDKYFFIAMEYLDGQNLSDVISAGALSPDRAAHVGIQLCEFLEAAIAFTVTLDGETRGPLLHGDLKPRNIRVLAGDEIKVFDFGIAKALSLSRKVTRNDFGSTAYLSPERIESGDVDAQAEFWAVGILLYEMVSGIQPFQAPDTRRLEQRIRARRPPALLDGRCPVALQAVIAKLLAGDVTDRYRSAVEIRDDLRRFASGEETTAQRDGWPAREHDEGATRRTHRPPRIDEEATRRTVRDAAPASKERPAVEPRAATPQAPSPPPRRRRRIRVLRIVRRALMLFALLMILNEISVHSIAAGLARNVPQDLDGLIEAWNQYDTLSERSMRIGTRPLERALIPQTAVLTDRTFARYRTATVVVRENQWRAARTALASALGADPSDRNLRAALLYCDGHLRRIDGEARSKAKDADAARQQLTAAVTAFRQAAELRPNWPDPFVGLMRTFVALDDMERGADALAQAQRYAYTAVSRDWAQLADGYYARAEKLAVADDPESLSRAADAYSHAIDAYAKVVGFPSAAQKLRDAQRRLHQVQERIVHVSAPAGGTTDTMTWAAPITFAIAPSPGDPATVFA
jgi:eukaryotic-like serine/threonine-protein kinase